MASSVEAELKFELVRADLEALSGGRGLDDLVVGTPEVADLLTTYWDTPAADLRAGTLSLRVRRKNGAFEQTVKAGGVPGLALSSRAESSVAIDGPTPDVSLIPDPDLRTLVAERIGAGPLEPAFTVAVQRTARILVTKAGDEIEYVLDNGSVIAGSARAEILEAEFELKSGDPRALFAVAKQALAGIPVRFSRDTKADRGYRLALGEPPLAWTPVKAVEPDLDPDGSVEEALRAVLRSCVAQIAANAVAVQAGDDAEGPHQLRVGLRRLRSALLAFRAVIDPVGAARLGGEVKWLGQVVGELRDIDVLIEEIVLPCGTHTDVKPLVAVLKSRREAIRARVVETLAGDRVGAFLIDLAAYTEGRGWLSFSDIGQTAALSEPVGDFARSAIVKRWTKVARMGRRADELDGEERHDLRKAFKKLRYTLDFFAGLVDRKDEKRMLKDVKTAQELLGYLNDVRMAEGLPAIVHADPAIRKRKDAAVLERTIGFCLGWHQARAEAAWTEAKTVVALGDAPL
ncbi:CYTH and CHAD domain-containing protein [Mongoliimonas terrestris]|uniref:CYTH and CHAD domain-containing protein n=1 Tax=Mongoliimonas terrestris TaxID=1709001 RepID=UPI00094987B1|nr:CYTH and CHAD domain-containing protein [Mongoliimonas terrestris]